LKQCPNLGRRPLWKETTSINTYTHIIMSTNMNMSIPMTVKHIPIRTVTSTPMNMCTSTSTLILIMVIHIVTAMIMGRTMAAMNTHMRVMRMNFMTTAIDPFDTSTTLHFLKEL
jgi:hypothetical protein